MKADLMATIEALQRQSDVDGIRRLMSEALAWRGFGSFIISSLPTSNLDMRPFVQVSGWPEEWHSRYAAEGYLHVDPVARFCATSATPFNWADAPYDRDNDLAARRVWSEARDFNMGSGYCVPIHMANDIHGAVSMVGDMKAIDPNTLNEVHILALYAHGQMRNLHRTLPPQAQKSIITSREIEVLKWVSTGRTTSEIAAITGLTARTVNQHCENAQRRLGTKNRVHTVVEAIRLGLIVL